MGLAEDLTALAELFERGVLSPQQFDEAKARLLGGDDDMPLADTSADYDLAPPSPPHPSQGVEPSDMLLPAADPEAVNEDDALDAASYGRALRRRTIGIGAVTVGVVLVAMAGAALTPDPGEPEPLTITEAAERAELCKGVTDYTCDEELFYNIVVQFYPGDHLGVPEAEVVQMGHDNCVWLDVNNPQHLGDVLRILIVEADAPTEDVGYYTDVLGTAAATLCERWAHLWEEL